ncbi:MAG: EAL domain-containing protein [Thermodesulfobacteriota bacterium]
MPDEERNEILNDVQALSELMERLVQNEASLELDLTALTKDGRKHLDSLKQILSEWSKYKNLFENVAEGLFQCALDGQLALANRAMTGLFGYDSLKEMIRAAPDFGGQCFREPHCFKDMCGLVERFGRVDKYEAEAVRKDGSTFWISINAHLAGDPSGRAGFIQGSIQDVTERKRIETRLLQEGHQDPLTGLVNRSMFMDLLDKNIARARRRENFSFALMSLTVDRFRIIRDSLGLSVADLLLNELAKILSSCLRTEDTCARLGGHEFGLILSDVFKVADAIRVIERLNGALKKPIAVLGNDVYVAIHCGVVMSSRDYAKPEEMLSDADSAMYRAQTDPSLTFAVFNETMQKEALERLRVETDLRKAIERGEFRLYYQPIVSVHSGDIIAFEALIRWERPGFGLISPLLFVPLLEETGLIIPAGEWVVKEACRQLAVWQNDFRAYQDLTVSVNVSARQLDRPGLVTLVDQALKETSLRPGCLKLELTESVVMSRPERAETVLRELKSLGVNISIDDFGTGYSSLAYLDRLPADFLKIDKSFVTGLKEDKKGSAIVRAILALAHTLDKQVVAEGVETSRQLSQLIKLECDYVQGYYFSKPVPGKEAGLILAHGLSQGR